MAQASRSFSSSASSAIDLSGPNGLALRARLLVHLRDTVQRKGWNQAQAAEQLGISRASVDDLLRGKVDAFSLAHLAAMAERSGLALDKVAALVKQGLQR